MRCDMNPGKADFFRTMGRTGKRRWLAVILGAVCLIGIGLALKSQLPVERPMRALSQLNPADGGANPVLRAGERVVTTQARGGGAGILVVAAPGKRIFEQSNGVIKLSILANGTYRVSMPGRPGEFRTWEGHKPLDAGNHFKVPAGICIKVRNRAGEILSNSISAGGWHTPLAYSSSATFGFIIGQEPKLVDAVGDSGLVDLCDLTAFLGDETHKLPDVSDLEFKILVKPSGLMLFKADGSSVTEADFNDIETGWIGGRYLIKRE